MNAIPVRLGERSYEIRFGALGSGLRPALRSAGVAPSRIFVVTTRAVAKAGHLRRLVGGLKGLAPGTSAVLPNGERYKTLAMLEKLYRAALAAGLDRRSLVIGLGGGVVTDMAGFMAATYMRGLHYVSVPTSLLGMVDAAIGGKTGVDMPEGKNLVGAFWQPKLVWIDPSVLGSLSQRDWTTGFAEIVKYGVIKSRPFFDWLDTQARAGRDPRTWKAAAVQRAIFESARMKAQVVSGDERETPLAGGREILNFGHTAGHALEAATGYGRVSHGEAISIGMNVAGLISIAMGLWSEADHLRMLRLLRSFGLPIVFPKLSAAQRRGFWAALRKDKKNVGGSLRFVLPRRIGQVEVRSGIPSDLVRIACGAAGLAVQGARGA